MQVDWTIDMPTIMAILSLVFVVLIFAYEQRQTRKQLKIQNFSDYTSRYQDIIVNLPFDVMDEDFDIDSLEKDERERCLKWMKAYFDLCAEEYFLNRKAVIDRDIWLDWKEGMVYVFNRPAFLKGWKIVSRHRDIYSSFKPFVAGNILRERTPDA